MKKKKKKIWEQVWLSCFPASLPLNRAGENQTGNTTLVLSANWVEYKYHELSKRQIKNSIRKKVNSAFIVW